MSLADHLLQQACEVVTGADLFVAQHLIDLIDEAGYLTENLLSVANRLGVPLARIEQVLAVIQTFDPTGVDSIGRSNLSARKRKKPSAKWLKCILSTFPAIT